MRTDAEIQQAVLQELKWDPRVEETDVGVEVDTGVVTLTGSVSSYATKVAAREAAHRVAGVRDVADDVQVRLPSDKERTDTDIAQTVRRALEWDVYIPQERITSTVMNGWVTLDGTVDYSFQADDAERAVRRLEGVRGVNNRIGVQGTHVAPGEVRLQIEDALERRAERVADRVTIGVADGTVTLSGAVQSWREREAVVGAARGTAGVHTVKDLLTITG